jgi:hypothetical protein
LQAEHQVDVKTYAKRPFISRVAFRNALWPWGKQYRAIRCAISLTRRCTTLPSASAAKAAFRSASAANVARTKSPLARPRTLTGPSALARSSAVIRPGALPRPTPRIGRGAILKLNVSATTERRSNEELERKAKKVHR